MPEPTPPEFDELMGMWREGDREALRALIPPLYEELRRIARRQLPKAAPVRTLQTIALVHEAYLRLHQDFRGQFQNKAHFMGVCALLMRQILVGYERNRRAAKRGGGDDKCTLEDFHAIANGRPVDLLDLDRALTALSKLDPERPGSSSCAFSAGFRLRSQPKRWGYLPQP